MAYAELLDAEDRRGAALEFFRERRDALLDGLVEREDLADGQGEAGQERER